MAVSVERSTLQPSPASAVAVKPAGSESTMLTVPLVASRPLLLTVIVYVSPMSPGLKLPTCVEVTVRSGAGGGAKAGTNRLATGVPMPVTRS